MSSLNLLLQAIKKKDRYGCPNRMDYSEPDMNLSVGQFNRIGPENPEHTFYLVRIRIQNRFDTYTSYVDDENGRFKVQTCDKGQAMEKILDKRIEIVAEQLKRGYLPENIGDEKIAIALTAAYLDANGGLATNTNLTKDFSKAISSKSTAIIPFIDMSQLFTSTKEYSLLIPK